MKYSINILEKEFERIEEKLFALKCMYQAEVISDNEYNFTEKILQSISFNLREGIKILRAEIDKTSKSHQC